MRAANLELASTPGAILPAHHLDVLIDAFELRTDILLAYARRFKGTAQRRKLRLGAERRWGRALIRCGSAPFAWRGGAIDGRKI